MSHLIPRIAISAGRNQCRQSKPFFSLLLIFLILTASFCLLSSTSKARAGVLPDWLKADFLEDLDTQGSATFMTSGSAYVEPSQGLRVNESGINLINDPSFEVGGTGWTMIGDATSAQYTGIAYHGLNSQLLTINEATAGAYISRDFGGIDLDKLSNDGAFTFSVYLKSTTDDLESVMLFISGETAWPQFAGPFQVGPEWQRFSVTGRVENFYAAGIMPGSTGTTPVSILVDAAQLENRSYDTTYFDGDQVGSFWSGLPHSSASIRKGGLAYISNKDVALDFTQPFWFALDMTIGFDWTDTWGTAPRGSKDFLNIGTPSGTGYGMAGNEGVILDYYSATGKFSFSKINRRGSVSYPATTFSTGDTLRAVCAYDPKKGMDMWIRLGENYPVHIVDYSWAAKQPALIGESWILSVSDCQAWSGYGNYQSNSLHRNLVVSQGTIDQASAYGYISDPTGFIADFREEPELYPDVNNIYWATVDDYRSRLLSVDFRAENLGVSTAHAFNIIDVATSNGVILTTAMPITVGDISSDSPSLNTTLQLYVPHGVGTFQLSIYAMAENDNGLIFYFPTPPPRP